jgi:hypothetical protein
MARWSIWSLVVLSPYFFGMWRDRGSLLYVAGVVFAALIVLSFFFQASSRESERKSIHYPVGTVLVHVAVNGVLVLFLNPWLLGVIYAGILIIPSLRDSVLMNAPKNMEGANGAKGCFDRPEGTGEGVPRRNTFRGGIG